MFDVLRNHTNERRLPMGGDRKRVFNVCVDQQGGFVCSYRGLKSEAVSRKYCKEVGG